MFERGNVGRGALLVVAAFAAAVVPGCGGDDEGAPAEREATLERPKPPTAEDCAVKTLATSTKPDDLVPRAGTYRYATTGTRRVLGGDGTSSRLPKTSQTIITPALKAGSLRCFRVQRRFGEQLGDTVTLVVRGGDLYITQLDSVAGGQLIELRPNPPIRSVPGEEVEWRGSFRGPTSGSYAGAVIDRRRINGEQAVGLKLQVVSSGEVEGSEKSTRWVSLDRNLVLSETVVQQREFGLDRLELRSTSKLVE